MTSSADVLSAILRELRLESAGYNKLELRAPWALSFAQQGLRGVHIVSRGRCEIAITGGPAQQLETGDLVITPRADPHVLRSIGAGRLKPMSPSAAMKPVAPGRVRGGGTGEETIIVCGAFVFHEADHPALTALPPLIHVRAEHGRAPHWLAGYVEALTAEAFDGGPGSSIVMARLSDALIARALRHHAGQAAEPGWLMGLRDLHVARALAAIHEHVEKPWTLAALASIAGLSRAAFAARFAEKVGEPPMRYLQGRRMREAMALLRDERATLASVAASVGYGSEASLSAAFKRHTGLPPGAYRRGTRS